MATAKNLCKAAARDLGPQMLQGMRILVIMPSIPVQGMERSNLQIMKMLRQRGADVLCITERTWGRELQREVELIDCHCRPASILTRLRLPKTIKELVDTARAWSRASEDIYETYISYNPTHIHVTNFDYFMYSLPTLWRAQCPVVFRLPNPPNSMLPRSKRVISNWIWRRLVLPRCDAVVCNCQYTLNEVLRLGLSPNRGHVIYNCLAGRSTLCSDVPQLASHLFHVVYVGRIRPNKGVGELFEAAERIVRERSDVDFHFVGEFAWKNTFAEKLMGKVAARGLNSRLRFHGPIREVFGLLAQCHLHVSPSTSPLESFPNVILEAKSQGLPSVVFPTAGIPEAVTHGVDGYVCSEPSPDELYKGIQFYLDRPEKLRRASEAAKKSLDRYSEPSVGDRWATLFLQLTSPFRTDPTTHVNSC